MFGHKSRKEELKTQGALVEGLKTALDGGPVQRWEHDQLRKAHQQLQGDFNTILNHLGLRIFRNQNIVQPTKNIVPSTPATTDIITEANSSKVGGA